MIDDKGSVSCFGILRNLYHGKRIMGRKERNECMIEIAVGAALFAALFIWGLVQPIGSQPDEQCRYVLPYYIMREGKLPNGNVSELVINTWGISYAFFPGLPYLVMALFMKVTSLFTANSYALLMAARVVNMLAGVVSYVFVRKTAKKLFSNQWTGWFFTLTAVFWPQAMFIFTYVNCDAFACMSCAIMVYALVSGLKESWTVKNYVTLSVGIAICALSYYNAYGMVLGSIIVFLVSFFYRKENGKTGFAMKDCLRIGFTIAGIVFVLAGWWFIRSAVLNDGDFLGFAANRRSAELYAVDSFKPSVKETFRNTGYPIYCLLFHEGYREMLVSSFFGRFGNMDLSAPNYVLRGFKIILFIGILGLLLPNRRKAFTGAKRAGFFAGMFVAALTPLLLAYWYAYASDFQAQGRYLLPGLIPMLSILFMGIQNITDCITKITEKKAVIGTWLLRVLYMGSYVYIAAAAAGSIYTVWRRYYPVFSETIGMVFTGGPV